MVTLEVRVFVELLIFSVFNYVQVNFILTCWLSILHNRTRKTKILLDMFFPMFFFFFFKKGEALFMLFSPYELCCILFYGTLNLTFMLLELGSECLIHVCVWYWYVQVSPKFSQIFRGFWRVISVYSMSRDVSDPGYLKKKWRYKATWHVSSQLKWDFVCCTKLIKA